jgi:integrase
VRSKEILEMKNHRKVERAKGFEPSTLTLATLRSGRNTSRILSSVVSEYFSQKPKTERYWKELRHRFDIEIVPALGSFKHISLVTKRDIRTLIWEKAKTHPAAARTMWDGLRPFFRWCVEWDYLDASPMADLSPPPAPASRDRILTEDEIRAVWAATEDDWYWSSFFRLLLLTGQRREEISYAVIGSHNTIIIPSSITKTKDTSVIPITPMIAYEYHRKTYQHPSGYSKAISALHRRSKTNDWRIHDLRRTFASGLAMLGTDPFVIERLLNHKIPGIKGVYNQYSYLKEKRQAIELWCTYIFSLTTDTQQQYNVDEKGEGIT